jgi:outer membrane protein TolC
MKRLPGIIIIITIAVSVNAQYVLDLDSCRALAMANNKELLTSNEKINAAHYQRKAAFTNYLPSLSATGAYMRNQKEISLLSNEQKRNLPYLGTAANGKILQDLTPVIGSQYPTLAPLLPLLGGTVEASLNETGTSLVDALRTDTRNLYVGTLTLTQPIFMGGKIRAYNKITKYAEELAKQQYNSELQEVILHTDQVYWQVVSLVYRKQLAESYLQLLQKLDADLEKMIIEGIATKAEGLTVKVKVNEAEIALTKVEDGLNLSRMLLCQLCGLDLIYEIILKDENVGDIPVVASNNHFVIESAYANRPEIKSLELTTAIYQQKINVERAEYLPTIAFVGNYIVSNPSTFNGFETKFRGMWNLGLTMQLPLWNWGQGLYKVKAAKAEARIAQYQLEATKAKIELQVNQSVFKVTEAAKKLSMTNRNLEKANENLRCATLGFEEGVLPARNVLEAQTAWLSAQSEKIDAQIDVRLTKVYLEKALGELTPDK